METAAILSTGFALVLLAGCVLSVVKCVQLVDRCRDHVEQLRQSRGRLIANEKSIEALNDRVHSLTGRVSKLVREVKGGPLDGRPSNNGLDLDVSEPDPELRDLLSLQSAPPAKP